MNDLMNSVSDEWFNAVCWSSLLFRIFIIKKCVEFSLTFYGLCNKENWNV